MARTSVLERKPAVRTAGALFIALVLVMVWVTYAFFDKKFTDYDNVLIRTASTGVNLPQNADIKLRGMIVGEVRKVEPYGDGVQLTLGMNPKLIGDVPRDVSAQIVPKTLFGEKYVALIPSDDPSTESLRAGDVIAQAEVPIEVEKLLNDAYPLLTAVDPANLSYTLTALSDALSGRGKQLGETLVTANRYLKDTNPDVPQLVDDLVAFGTVSDGYAAALPDLGRLLENATVTGNTIVAKRAQLAAFFDEGTRLASTLTDFTEANGDNLVALADNGRPTLEMLGEYSPTFPCFLGGMRKLIPRLDSAFRDDMLHINLKVVPEPTGYDKDETLQISQKDFDEASVGPSAKSGSDVNARNAASPTCLDLKQIVSGDQATIDKLSSQANPFKVPASVYELVNIKNDHNKFGEPEEFGSSILNRPAVGDITSKVQPSMTGLDTPLERAALTNLLGASLGVSTDEVPDLGALMVGPILRGAGVTVE